MIYPSESDRALYNSLCRIVDDMLIKSSIRKICIKCSTIKPYNRWKDDLGCCTGCKHLGESGCTTNSLTCKLWLCSPDLFEKLPKKDRRFLCLLKKLSVELGFIGIRMDFDDILAREILFRK